MQVITKIIKDSNQAFSRIVPEESMVEIPKCPNCQAELTCFCKCPTCDCEIHVTNKMRTVFEQWYASNNTNMDMGDTIAGTLEHLRQNRTPKGYKVGWFSNELCDAWELFQLGWNTAKEIYQQNKE